MNSKYVYISILIFLFFYSCSLFDPNKETEVLDAIPPKGYNPIFIKSVKDFNEKSDDSVKLNISNIEFRGNEISLNVHLIDSMKTLLSGLNDKSIWCEINDSTQSGEKLLKNFDFIEIDSSTSKNLSLAIVMDLSGSMGYDRAMTMQEGVAELIKSKRPDDKIALINYDSKLELTAPFSDDVKKLISNHKLNGLHGFGGLTATRQGIKLALEELDKLDDDSKKAVIVFTDGFDNSSKIQTDELINMAKSKAVPVHSVDYGPNTDAHMLQQIALNTGGIYHQIYLTHEFKYLFDDLYRRMNNYYTLRFNSDHFGYHKVKIKLCLDGKEFYAEQEYDNSPAIGKITLLNVYFDHNKSSIKQESQPILKSLASYLKSNPSLSIEIHGHTDSTGDINYNKSLSEKRAAEVSNYLVSAGITKNRIETIGFGPEKPIADNETEEGRAMNRRTEFILK